MITAHSGPEQANGTGTTIGRADSLKGAADKAGTKADSEHVLRYIITRPCLSEGQLHLLKYLQPYFPDDGTVTFQDSRGDTFTATVERAGRRLTGLGELYRAHHLGVNDVLLLTPRANNVYDVECVVKPHARPAVTAERPAPTPPATEKRVVIHATPHVREVRMERINAPEASGSQPDQAAPSAAPTPKQGASGQTAQPTQAAVSTGQVSISQMSAGQVSISQASPSQAAVSTAPQQSAANKAGPRSSMTQATAPAAPHSQPPAAQPLSQSRPSNTVSQKAAPAPMPVAARLQPDTSSEVLRPVAQPASSRPPTGATAAKASPVALAVKPTTEVKAATVSTAAPHSAPPEPVAPQPQTTEQQLVQLAQLTGYTFDHLGDGVTRLRANLGEQSYSVLLALTPQAMQAPAWSERADYKALLTAEDERPQGTARFTQAALTSLLEHARLAPLTPVDLRGYWNTGSFDYRSVESVAELVSAHLAQRGIFSHVLMTLAQQPAHSLVQVARLAERLGSGVNTAELQSILETLSRPPFMALTPLPGEQFYLRGDVRDLLGEVSDYAEGMRRRLK
ncbi:hypothetical protein [Deinococcus ruber]|uniref:Uncharacterized protein n=1 Tax=Deinococcus ruber TaxID=1848197 RepID=A0A918F9S7_9DEIO|nr:hypothetical protein [Deinococcus ruber]GGR22757.1 hypothetical protein GCM10008957_38500 [Deinococcus ruber]